MIDRLLNKLGKNRNHASWRDRRVAVKLSAAGAPCVEQLEGRRLLSAAGSLDPTFGGDGRVTTAIDDGATDDLALGVAIQSDGKSVVAGWRNDAAGFNFAVVRYNIDGSLDTTFSSDGKATVDFGTSNDYGYSVAVDSLGRILIGGNSGVARLNSDGSLDTSFDGDGKAVPFGGVVYSVAVDSFDRVVVGGYIYQGVQGYDFAIARLNALDGSLDASFDGDGIATVDFASYDVGYSVAVDGLDRILIAGRAGPGPWDSSDFALARLNTGGSLDTSFDGDGKATIDFGGNDIGYSVTVDSLGRLVIGGRTTIDYIGDEFAVARLRSDGSLDTSFDGDGRATVDFGGYGGIGYSVVVDSHDRIVIGGTTGEDRFEFADFAVVRLNSLDGSLDTSFDGDGKATVDFESYDHGFSVTVDSQDRIVIGGSTYQYPGHSGFYDPHDFAVARLNALDGSLDPTFDGDGRVTTDIGDGAINAFALAIAVQSDGKSVVVGWREDIAGINFAVIRYNTDGSLDSTFSGDGTATVDIGSYDYGNCVAVDSLGRIVIGGISGVARLNPDGSLDTSFGVGGIVNVDIGTVSSLAVDSFDRIAIGGYTYQGSSGNDFAVARLNTDGSPDLTFDGDGISTFDIGNDDRIYSVAVDRLDRIVIGGGTGNDFAVARLNTVGGLDMSFDGDGIATVDFGGYDTGNSVAVDGLGRIVVGGYTIQSYLGGSTAVSDFAVARLNPLDGSFDTTFDGDGKATVDFATESNDQADFASNVAVQADGKIVLGGYTSTIEFNSEGEVGAVNFDFAAARLNADGSLDDSFDGDGKTTVDFGDTYDLGFGMALQADGKIVLVGFSDQGSTDDFVLARLLGYSYSVVGTPANDSITIAPGTQSGTLKTTINGVITDNITVDGEIFVAGLGGNDAITITAALAGGIVVDGGDGSDTYDISLGSLAGTVNVVDNGTSGTDELTVRGTPENDYIFKDDSKVTLGNPVFETVLTSGVDSRIIHGGDGNDTIIDPGSNTHIFGDAGNDTIVIDATTGSGVTVDGGAGSDTYVIGGSDLAGPVAIADSGASGTDSVQIVGTPGDDTLVQTASGFVLNGVVIQVGTGFEAASVDGGGGAGDTFDVVGTPTIVATVQGVSDTVITGTAGNDIIRFISTNEAGKVQAYVNGVLVGTFRPTGQLIAHGLGGHDTISADGVDLPVVLYGDEGNDILAGGTIGDLIFGGAGDDAITGAAGNDFLFGGTGKDRIVGSAGHDILVAGDVDSALDLATLRAISQAWAASHTANNTETIDSVLDETVGDADSDILTGGAGADLFIINGTDKITDFQFGKPKTNKDGDVVLKDGVMTT